MLAFRLLKHLLSLLLLSNAIFLSAGAVATNRTIDDTTGDSATGQRPLYLPSTQNVWEGASCTGCAIQPSQAQAFKGTWTAATYNPGLKSMSIELSFKGTAIYVFFILANQIAPGITTETACNFTLDGAHAGLFSHTASSSLDLEYNALVFSNNNLRNTDHKLVIETNDVDRDIFVNFDYAIYTFDDTPTTTPSSSASPPVSSTANTPSSALPPGSSSAVQSSSGSSTTAGSTTPTSTTGSNSGTGNNNNGGNSNNNGNNSSSGENNSNSNSNNNSEQNSQGSTGAKSSTNVAAIAGGTVGGVVALLALFFGLLFCLKRRRQTHQDVDSPFPPGARMFAPLNHSNESHTPIPGPSQPQMQQYPQYEPAPLTKGGYGQQYNNAQSRPITHSDFLQTGTIVSPGPASDYSSVDAYGGMIPSASDPSSPRSMRTTLPSGEVLMGAGAGAAAAAAHSRNHSRSNSNTNLTSQPALTPMRRPSNGAFPNEKRARQQDIQNQLRSAQAEMQALQEGDTRLSQHPGQISQEQEIHNLREQMRMMSDQIQHLTKHQNSEWAQGLTDEPPPGYTPTFAVRN